MRKDRRGEAPQKHPPDGTFEQAAHCGRKKMFVSEQAARKRTREIKDAMGVYECNFCSMWHLYSIQKIKERN